METNKVWQGDCLKVMRSMEPNSVDAIVTDPPYGLSFMGKKWDYDVPSQEIWQEALRVLKPGGYLLAFAGTRTQHRMAVRIEDAGFEIRDMIAWIYGSGFPKSLNIQKAGGGDEWEGWGTALKPALEPITVARKPIEGTVASNCLKWGVGGINIDECRANKRFPANLIHDGSDEVVELFPVTGASKAANRGRGYGEGVFTNNCDYDGTVRGYNDNGGSAARFFYNASGEKHDIMNTCKNTHARTVLNFLQTIPLTIGSIAAKSATQTPNQDLVQNVKSAGITCGSCVTAIAQSLAAMATDNTASQVIQDCTTNYANSIPHQNLAEIVQQWANTGTTPTTANLMTLFGSVLLATDANTNWASKVKVEGVSDQERATRFLYCAKASKRERTANGTVNNSHPTIKPIALMEYLVKLVSREGAVVLDPFAGSGSTLIACKNLNRQYIGIEMDPDYVTIIYNRLAATKPNQLELV